MSEQDQQLRHPLIELRLDEDLTEARMREIVTKVQQNFEDVAKRLADLERKV